MISKFHPGVRWRLRLLREMVVFSPNDVVLDAGCADGYVSCELASSVSQVIGIDIASQLIQHNQRHIKLPNLRFVCADLRNLGQHFSEGTFSKIVCMDVLEHTSGFQDIVAIFSTILQPGGLLFLTIPVGGHGHFEQSDDQVSSILAAGDFSIVELQRVRPPGVTSLVMNVVGGLSRVLYGQREQADVWTETRSFQFLRREPMLFKVYRLFFPLLNWLTLLDRRAYRPGGGVLLAIASKVGEKQEQ